MPNVKGPSTSMINQNPSQPDNPNSRVTFGLRDPDSPSGTFFPQQTVMIEKDKKFQCGLLAWRPRCLQEAGNIKAFLAAACFISCLQAAYSGYAASQVTTLEKRFAVGSSVMGAVNSFFEIGYILSVVFVSYAGGRGHVPVWISCGLFVMSIGAVLWSLPHFLFRNTSSLIGSKITEPLCVSSSRNTNCTELSCTVIAPASSADGSVSGYAFLPIFFAAQLLIGGGSSPILTLAPPFIDDHVHPAKAPPMIASQYAAAAMGPVLGFALGALVLQYPADLFVPPSLKPNDPEWIGAWWVGFILLGMLVFLGAVILLLFPRKLIGLSNSPQKKLSTHQSAPVLQENGSAQFDRTPVSTRIDSTLQSTSEPTLNLRDPWSSVSRTSPRSRRSAYSCAPHMRCRIFESPENWTRFSRTVRSIVRNKIYLVVCLCICSEMFMIIGFASFLPKYLEMEYHISKSATSAIAGGLIVPSGALGILVGGLILNRFRFHRRAAIRFVVIINLVIIGCITSFFFLGCRNPPIAGVTVNYSTKNTAVYSEQGDMVVAECNSHCGCDRNAWFPMCHSSSGISFISPCFAGCTTRAVSTDPARHPVFQNCSCLPAGNGTYESDQVLYGLCPLGCNTIIPFVIVLTTCLFLTGVIQNPLLMVTMRSVNHNERSFALGLQFVIIRLFANMPSPIVFGRVIDEACRYWRFESGRRGDCAFVDVRKLNLYMTSLGMIIKGIGLFFYISLLYLLRSSPGSQSVNELGLGQMNTMRKLDTSPESSMIPSNLPINS